MVLCAQFIINKIGTVADFDREIPNLVQKVCMLFRGCMIKFKRTVFATKIREAFEKRLAACKEIEQNKQEAENKKRQNDAFRLKKIVQQEVSDDKVSDTLTTKIDEVVRANAIEGFNTTNACSRSCR